MRDLRIQEKQFFHSHLTYVNDSAEITQYFEKAEDKTFSTAKNHFGDSVSYGELRIVVSSLNIQETQE